MKKLKQLWIYWIEAFSEFKTHLSLYVFPLCFLIMIFSVERIVNWLPIIKAGEGRSIIVTVISEIVSTIVFVKIILIKKGFDEKMPYIKGQGELLFSAVSFILMTIYMTGTVVLGLLFFLLPGIYLLVHLLMAPLLTLYEPALTGWEVLKKAHRLAKKNRLILLVMAIISLLLEFITVLIPELDSFLLQVMSSVFLAALSGVMNILFILVLIRILKIVLVTGERVHD